LSWLQLTLPEGADPAAVEKVLDGALDQVVEQGVTDAELARVKNQYASSFWKQLATINGKAELLGSFEVYEGDYKKLFDSPAVYEKVTREDVQKAAGLVFQKNHRTVGLLQSPTAPPPATAAPAPAAAEAKP
jgi:zinc protease